MNFEVPKVAAKLGFLFNKSTSQVIKMNILYVRLSTTKCDQIHNKHWLKLNRT